MAAVGLLALCLLLAAGAQARPHRVSQIPNGSVNSCANCHINPGGGGPRNPFGQDVEARLSAGDVRWNAELASLDSDGDGFTNGQELQDPQGTWSAGQANPGTSALVSKPGDAQSVPNTVPVLATVGNRQIAEGDTLRLALSASDADGDGLTFSASGRPSGSALSDSTFTWVPGFNQAGTYRVTFSLSDGKGGTDSETITITVTDTNRPPVLSTIGDQQIAEGGTLRLTLSASDADGDGLTFSLSGNPAGSSLSGAVFTWGPGFDQAGAYPVEFTASDGKGSADSETITITVTDTNRPPLFSAVGDQSLAEGDTLRLVLSAADADGDEVSFSVSGNPAGSSLQGAVFTWVARAGTYPVEFTASDGKGGTDSETFTLTVTEVLTGDFDRSGRVDLADFFLFADVFGSAEPAFDLDGSGRVDFADFFIFADHFGEGEGQG